MFARASYQVGRSHHFLFPQFPIVGQVGSLSFSAVSKWISSSNPIHSPLSHCSHPFSFSSFIAISQLTKATCCSCLTENGLGIEIHRYKARRVDELFDPWRQLCQLLMITFTFPLTFIIFTFTFLFGLFISGHYLLDHFSAIRDPKNKTAYQAAWPPLAD